MKASLAYAPRLKGEENACQRVVSRKETVHYRAAFHQGISAVWGEILPFHKLLREAA